MKTGFKQLVTANELADMLNVGRSTIYRLTNKRTLPFYKVGGAIRFSMEDVSIFLKDNWFEPVDLNSYGNKKN